MNNKIHLMEQFNEESQKQISNIGEGDCIGFCEAWKRVWKYWHYFDGRATRSEYWWGSFAFLLQTLVISICVALMLLFAEIMRSVYEMNFWGAIIEIIGLLSGIILFGRIYISMIALDIRRFHDMGWSGWFCLLFIVLSSIPYLGYVSAILSIGLQGFIDSNKGTNKYGRSMKYPD